MESDISVKAYINIGKGKTYRRFKRATNGSMPQYIYIQICISAKETYGKWLIYGKWHTCQGIYMYTWEGERRTGGSKRQSAAACHQKRKKQPVTRLRAPRKRPLSRWILWVHQIPQWSRVAAVCLCIYTYRYLYIHTCTWICEYICIHICCIYMCIDLFKNVQIYMYIHVYIAAVYMYIYVHIYICVYIHTFIYVYIFIYTYMYM